MHQKRRTNQARKESERERQTIFIYGLSQKWNVLLGRFLRVRWRRECKIINTPYRHTTHELKPNLTRWTIFLFSSRKPKQIIMLYKRSSIYYILSQIYDITDSGSCCSYPFPWTYLHISDLSSMFCVAHRFSSAGHISKSLDWSWRWDDVCSRL